MVPVSPPPPLCIILFNLPDNAEVIDIYFHLSMDTIKPFCNAPIDSLILVLLSYLDIMEEVEIGCQREVDVTNMGYGDLLLTCNLHATLIIFPSCGILALLYAVQILCK